MINSQDSEGNTALHHLMMKWRWQSVKLILQYGASVNITNNKGQTALTVFLQKILELPYLEDPVIRPLLIEIMCLIISRRGDNGNGGNGGNEE